MLNPCKEGSTCVNHEGGYYCQCKPDYFGKHCVKCKEWKFTWKTYNMNWILRLIISYGNYWNECLHFMLQKSELETTLPNNLHLFFNIVNI